MTSAYWPLEPNIKQCIRTEAEELSEHVLLAVHEPMQLIARLAGDLDGKKVDEYQLLEHLIKIERPIPIIGESGVGKSHIIRWLDAQLKLQKNDQWHIVRIPKNASLRKVLISLLDGLEGETFDMARAKVNEIGEKLKTEDLVDYLVVSIIHRLEELYENTEKEYAAIQLSGQRPDNETKARIDRIKRHAKPDGLPALLVDIEYNKDLKNKCLYQIAKRLSSGSTEQEIEANNYTICTDDLDFNHGLNLSNLTLTARNYVRDVSLTTDPSRLQEATDLLNEVLSDACGIVFSQLFQFHGGGFQELFVEIRKYLYEQGKTLFILVEDMAAISAIEDVLIDSLIQEGVRDGVQELCSLHSAIAVTDGYIGYTRRRNTLATRAQKEWFISKVLDSETETYQRIENFCGRYLNAARYGENELQKITWSNQQVSFWESEEKEEKLRIEDFGRSDEGFALFPFNKPALKALANKYCKPNNELEFNPRKILGQILLNILPNFQYSYNQGQFPPAGLCDIKCSTAIESALAYEITSGLDRVQTLTAIWGYGASSLNELPSFLPTEIAREFSCDEFSDVLSRIKPNQIKKPVDTVVKITTVTKEVQKPHVIKEPVAPDADKSEQISEELDGWISKKNIPQNEALILRKALLKEIKNVNLDWYGVNKKPELKRGRGSQILIHIPYNKNQPAGCLLRFGCEDKIKSLFYREFILAVLRKEKAVGIDNDSWDFSGGYENYCTYINFINTWLPEQVQMLIEKEREKVKSLLENNLGIASAFDPNINDRSSDEKVNMLVRTASSEADDLKKSLELNFPQTGLDAWDVHLEKLRILWVEEQKKWLDLYSTNRHAIEADLVKKELRGLTSSIPSGTKMCAQAVTKELNKNYRRIDLLETCSTEEQFKEILVQLHNMVSKLSSANQFSLDMSSPMTAGKYLNLISKISADKTYWTTCKALLALKPGFSDNSIKFLSQINLPHADVIRQCLDIWTQFYIPSIERMKYENSEIGGDRREEAQKQIAQCLNDTEIQLDILEGEQ